MKESGRIRLLGLIILLIIIAGVYTGVKYFGMETTKTQIAAETKNTLRVLGRNNQAVENSKEQIRQILTKHSVYFDEEKNPFHTEYDRDTDIIKYQFRYRIILDLVVYQKEYWVEIIEQVGYYE